MINCYDSPDIPLGMGCHQCAWLSKKKMTVYKIPGKRTFSFKYHCRVKRETAISTKELVKDCNDWCYKQFPINQLNAPLVPLVPNSNRLVPFPQDYAMMNVVNMPTKDDIFDMIQSAVKPIEVKKRGRRL